MMNDDDLKKLFETTDKAPIRDSAKARSIALAIGEFNAAKEESEKNANSYQGNATPSRPTDKSEQISRSNFMQFFNQRWFLGGTATACAALFGVVLFNNLGPNTQARLKTDEQLSELTTADNLPHEEISYDIEEVVVAHGIRGSMGSADDLKGNAATVRLSEAASPKIEHIAENAQAATQPMAPVTQRAKRERSQKLAAKPAIAKFKSLGFASAKNPPENYVLRDTSKPTDFYLPPIVTDGENRNDFEEIEQNSIKQTTREPVSTFSVDVDTASYSFVRRQLNRGRLPSKSAVRLEEMVNYFDYNYPLPESKDIPFKASISVSKSPWKKGNKLIHVGIKGYDIVPDKKPAVNLVFLLDVSGSMSNPDKLPLVKQSMHLLLSQLAPEDTVAIAVYAGAAGTVLEPTPVKNKQIIIKALDKLQAGGSTAGAEGIKLAYQLAESNYNKNSINRIILATDGDFNVGISDTNELKAYVERKRKSGVFLSVLGFGDGNYQDHLMQTLAQNGNGVAAYIDTLSEAQKVLVNEAQSSLFTIAKDVKIQMEFNPDTVSEYRLLGYETRALKQEDFNNDAVDAGEIGSGHTVTAIYEITPKGADSTLMDKPRYTANDTNKTSANSFTNEYGFLKIRYKLPNEDKSKLITTAIPAKNNIKIHQRELEFGIAVAGFSELLRGSKYIGSWNYDDAINQAQENKGNDEFGYRTEFVQLIRKAKMAAAM